MISTISFIYLRKYLYYNVGFEVYSLSFVILISIISFKFKIENKILLWLGNNVFWIYILQRIPMIFFYNTSLINHAYRYSIIVFILTILLSILVSNLIKKITEIIRMTYIKSYFSKIKKYKYSKK